VYVGSIQAAGGPVIEMDLGTDSRHLLFPGLIPGNIYTIRVRGTGRKLSPWSRKSHSSRRRDSHCRCLGASRGLLGDMELQTSGESKKLAQDFRLRCAIWVSRYRDLHTGGFNRR